MCVLAPGSAPSSASVRSHASNSAASPCAKEFNKCTSFTFASCIVCSRIHYRGSAPSSASECSHASNSAASPCAQAFKVPLSLIYKLIYESALVHPGLWLCSQQRYKCSHAAYSSLALIAGIQDLVLLYSIIMPLSLFIQQPRPQCRHSGRVTSLQSLCLFLSLSSMHQVMMHD